MVLPVSLSECCPTAPTAPVPGAVPCGTRSPPAPGRARLPEPPTAPTRVHPPDTASQCGHTGSALPGDVSALPCPRAIAHGRGDVAGGVSAWLLPVTICSFTYPKRALGGLVWSPETEVTLSGLSIPAPAIWGHGIGLSPPVRDPCPRHFPEVTRIGSQGPRQPLSTLGCHPWGGSRCLRRTPAWFSSILGSFPP